MSYVRFITDNRGLLGFGFLLAMVSSFGQTWFIGLFKERLLDDYGLTHGKYGTLYGAATMTSAACLAYLGRQIDNMDLRRFTLLVCLGLGGACFLMSFAQSMTLLFCALLGLRLFGQGLSSHVASTSAARYFDAERGRALSVANLGHPAGEAVLPKAAFALLATVAVWQSCWQIVGAVVVLIVLPLSLFLLRGHGERHTSLMRSVASAEATETRRQWTAGEVLRDPWFLMVLPVVLAPPFIGTAIMFHQDVLRDQLDWSKAHFARAFVVFAVFQVCTAPLAGALVDWFTARRLMPFYMIPYGAGLVAAALVPGVSMVYVMMASLGFSSAFAVSVVGAAWAERYGVRHVGAIRSQVSVAMVISTAGAPPLLGYLIDNGVSIQMNLLMLAVYIGVASILVAIGNVAMANES